MWGELTSHNLSLFFTVGNLVSFKNKKHVIWNLVQPRLTHATSDEGEWAAIPGRRVGWEALIFLERNAKIVKLLPEELKIFSKRTSNC